eukprot:gnl/MRDRNA2_/MRDRNA2_29104_c0_seq1.p1 gnl/MRDRNA2_/MRDRNA2_29104_c0~~gnl/MRDRNA2_/MRDRNA2_29104_c0_seq1.p1  ORF type:complete len:410 (-),score=89.31 gnl/MRDRNA2_/MRDRNA2_29104_c0_seq1:398-1627(-)
MTITSNAGAEACEEDRKLSNFANNLSKKGPKSGLDSLLGVFGFSAGDSDDPAAEDSSTILPVPAPSAAISLSSTEPVSPPSEAVSLSHIEPFWTDLQKELTLINTDSSFEEQTPFGTIPAVPQEDHDEEEGNNLLQDPTGPPGQYYKGQFMDQMKHGKGVLHYYVPEKGRLVYAGDFVQNKKHGEGILKWASGQHYQGQFLNDDFHGEGNMSWPDGNQYVGQYVNGRKNGIGTCFFPDGSKYYGQFRDGKRHGEVTRVKVDGTTQLLHFHMDKLEKADRMVRAIDSSEGGETHRSLISDCTTDVRSSVSKTTHESSACSSATMSSNESSKSKSLQRWRVVHQDGASVRSTDSFFSKKVGTIRKGQEMTVAEVKGRQMRIVKPFEGWVAARTQGWHVKLIAVRIDKEVDM